jgi:hypothetical protein
LQVFLSVSERQRAAALHDASRDLAAFDSRISVLECGGPPPLSAQSISRHDLKPRYSTSFSWAFLSSRQNFVLHPVTVAVVQLACICVEALLIIVEHKARRQRGQELEQAKDRGCQK